MSENSANENFSLEQVMPKIWHLNFGNRYDLTIHFFRVQQHYEAPDVHGKYLEFVDLMDKYQKRFKKDSFTYTRDWDGFNIPGKEILKLYEHGIKDLNRLDMFMYSIATYIQAKEDSSDFYIIGTTSDDPCKNATFNHELAHGLYYVNKEYKQKMLELISKIDTRTRKRIYRILKKWGYTENIFEDEAQAYLATGLQDELESPNIIKYKKPFIKIFNTYSKGYRKKSEIKQT